MKQYVLNAVVVENVFVSNAYTRLTILAPEIAEHAKPGMFVSFLCGPDTTLRRPFAVMQTEGERVTFLIKVVGKGTEFLSAVTPGETLSAFGPLGNAFPLPKKNERAILVGGGVGIPPLYNLAKTLSREGIETAVFIGARTKEGILLEREFVSLAKVYTATDDGSYGRKGTVIDLLEETAVNGTALYACGPKAVLNGARDIALKKAIPSWLSLEAYMGCGYGACLGCAVETTEGYALCCADGPVFEGARIRFA